MTHLEILLGGIVLALFTGLLGIVLGGKKKVQQDDFSRHLESEFPHPACRVHTSKLIEIEKIVSRIDARIYKLVSGSTLSNEVED